LNDRQFGNFFQALFPLNFVNIAKVSNPKSGLSLFLHENRPGRGYKMGKSAYTLDNFFFYATIYPI